MNKVNLLNIYSKISIILLLGIISNYADDLRKGYGDKDFIFTGEDGKEYNFIFDKVLENDKEINVCNSITFLFNLLKNSIDKEELENIKERLIEAGKKKFFSENDILLEKFIFVKLNYKKNVACKYVIKKDGKYLDLNLKDEIKLTDNKGEKVYEEDETFSKDKFPAYIYLVKSIKLIENKKIDFQKIFKYLGECGKGIVERTLKCIKINCKDFSIKKIRNHEYLNFYREVIDGCYEHLDCNEQKIFNVIYKTPEVEEILNKRAQELKKEYIDSNTKFKLEVTFKFENSETSKKSFDVTPNMTYKELYNIIKEKSKEIYLDKDPLINNLYINGSLLEKPEENSNKILLDIKKIEFLVKKDNKDEEKKENKENKDKGEGKEDKCKGENKDDKPVEEPQVEDNQVNDDQVEKKPVDKKLGSEDKVEKKPDEKEENKSKKQVKGGCCKC